MISTAYTLMYRIPPVSWLHNRFCLILVSCRHRAVIPQNHFFDSVGLTRHLVRIEGQTLADAV
jgi:hypothetical protein